jgi:DNA polymerase III sliding clamp (beta) subunit (PCNA family)
LKFIFDYTYLKNVISALKGLIDKTFDLSESFGFVWDGNNLTINIQGNCYQSQLVFPSEKLLLAPLEPVFFSISAPRIYNVLSVSSTDKIVLTYNDKNATVVLSNEDAKFSTKIACVPNAIPPQMLIAGQYISSFELIELDTLISCTSFCASTDNLKPVLSGINFVFDGEYVQLSATDTFRLAITQMVKNVSNNATFTIPATYIEKLFSSAKKIGFSNVIVSNDGNRFLFDFDGILLFCITALDGNYPVLNSIKTLPKNFVTLDTGVVEKAITYVTSVGSDNVALHIREDTCLFYVTNKIDESSIEINTLGASDNFSEEKIRINLSLLKSCVDKCRLLKFESIRFLFNGATSPFYILGELDEKHLFVIMPIGNK